MFSTRMIAVFGALVATTTVAQAQEPEITTPAPADDAFHKGTLGLSLPLTLLSNITTGLSLIEPVPTVDIVYFLSDKAAIDLIAGFNFHRAQVTVAPGMTESDNLFGFAVGLGYRMYSSKNNLRSFIEPQGVVYWPDSAASETLSLRFGATMGVERNVTPWFSFSGAVGLVLNLTNGVDDVQFATSANLAANLYWH